MVETVDRGQRRPRYPVYSTVNSDNGVNYIDGINFYRHYEGSERSPNAIPLLIYPPLGNAWVVLDFVAHSLGLPTVTDLRGIMEKGNVPFRPPVVNKQTINWGVSKSPEFVCYPFKPMLGYYMQMAALFEEFQGQYGFDYYPIFLGHKSKGTCRERVYNTLHEAIINEFYKDGNLDFYIAEESIKGIVSMLSFIVDISGKNGGRNLLKTALGYKEVASLITEGVRRLSRVEALENSARYTQCLITGKYFEEVEYLLEEYKIKLASPYLPNDLREFAVNEFHYKLGNIEKRAEDSGAKPRNVPKGIIGVTGEIYCVSAMNDDWRVGRALAQRGFFYKRTTGPDHYAEKFNLSSTNLFRQGMIKIFRYLEKKYENIKDGINYKDVYEQVIGEYENKQKKKDKRLEVTRKAGLDRDLGGHSVETLFTYQETCDGDLPFDGLIILEPFNCLPQIMVANILRTLQDRNLPYYRFIFDEQTGDAGLITRIEAWLDLVEAKMKREQKMAEGINYKELQFA